MADGGPALLELTERELVAAARRGQPLECSELAVDQLVHVTPVIRADVIGELVLGRRGDLDPRGISVSGARITGCLDLSFVHVTTNIELVACALDAPVLLRDARVGRLMLNGSRLVQLFAQELQVDGDLFLSRASVDCAAVPPPSEPDEPVLSTLLASGAIRLVGATVGGQFECVDAALYETQLAQL